ncbi:MAG: hypothetical protein RIC36_16795 [Rhodospirillales bacterium]
MFDSYLMVDWSAAATPRTGADSIWCCLSGPGIRPVMVNPSTRQAATDWIIGTLSGELSAGRRVLAGFDFPIGYSRGFAGLLQPGGQPWRATWDLLSDMVQDRPDNANNRFDVAADLNRRCSGRAFPFWGHPHGRHYGFLQPKKAVGYGELAERRHADSIVPGTQPVWKLLGAGSVGSQALTGIARLHQVRFSPALSVKTRVWPFETGWREPADEARIVLAEVYPTPLADPPEPGEPKDAGQVRGAARRFAALDAAGELAKLFHPPQGTTPEMIQAVEAEEGWILGAPFNWVT